MLVLVDEHDRHERVVKSASQNATVAYALLFGPTEVAALVQLGNVIYEFSFRVAAARDNHDDP